MKNYSLSLLVAVVLVCLFSGLGLAQDAPPAAITGSGTADFIPRWTATTTLGNSILFQTPNGKVGIGTTKPASTLDVKGGGTIRGLFSLPATGTATVTAGFNSQPMNLAASAFSSTTSTAVNQTFQWQAEPAGNDTSTPSGSLNLLFGEGATKPSETGFNIASNGQITFAAGQTFPGVGSVTSIGSGAGLTGGPITSSGTLSILTGGVSNAMLANPALTVTAGTALTGGGSVALGGTTTLNLDTTQVPQLATINTFTNENVFTNLVVSNYDIAGNQAQFNTGGANGLYVSTTTTSSDGSFQVANKATPSNSNFTEVQFNTTQATFFTDTLGDTTAIGVKHAAVPLGNGQMVDVSSMESPEVWFEDFGSGRLSGGSTMISLDSKFTQTVNLAMGYHVFLTPKGDCKGLFVTGETDHGFEVRELGGGKSSVELDYRIVAHRKGYETMRLPVAILPVRSEKALGPKLPVVHSGARATGPFAAKLNAARAVVNKNK
jgi:hypothetical protein